MELFAEDWQALFELLEDGRIKPLIAKKFTLQDVVEANRLMESEQVTGNVVVLPDVSNSAGQLASDKTDLLTC